MMIALGVGGGLKTCVCVRVLKMRIGNDDDCDDDGLGGARLLPLVGRKGRGADVFNSGNQKLNSARLQPIGALF